jgi:tetratricopeptide (TPR) repeat protein
VNGDTESLYYRLGLMAARRRDLKGAALYARYALALNVEHGGAAKLLEICLEELGESASGGNAPNGSETPAGPLAAIRALVEKKKWRAAEKIAELLPIQSVRILNIRGCLLAAAKSYARAAACFAKALTMDRFNSLAAEGFAETSRPGAFIWKWLWRK